LESLPGLGNADIAVEPSPRCWNSKTLVTIKQLLIHEQVIFDPLNIRSLVARVSGDAAYIR
jgi:hypothetical protein